MATRRRSKLARRQPARLARRRKLRTAAPSAPRLSSTSLFRRARKENKEPALTSRARCRTAAVCQQPATSLATCGSPPIPVTAGRGTATRGLTPVRFKGRLDRLGRKARRGRRGFRASRATRGRKEFRGRKVRKARKEFKAQLEAGLGDVVGPASAMADHIPQFSGTTGKLIKDGKAAPVGAIVGTLTRKR